MPRPDPAPTTSQLLQRRFWRVFRVLALLSLAIAALAVVIVARGESEWRIHMVIATGLGIGLMVLVGTSLMTLTFLSASSGHDDEAGETPSSAHQKDSE